MGQIGPAGAVTRAKEASVFFRPEPQGSGHRTVGPQRGVGEGGAGLEPYDPYGGSYIAF